MTIQKIKKADNISPVENVKLFQACEVNDTRKNYNKLWTSVKPEALEIVERVGGSVISKYKSKAYYMEIAKKATKRFDVTSFKEKHPHLYNKYLIDGEAVELKTKIVK
ncbi:hypothetical protein HTVC023P_gp27 [Pelagibacter phage HTVC023P]|jgi:hypothetical protein|nr:hypothetical protein HTVC023P_gp27 [Pelagibacter phage HTVC023P]